MSQLISASETVEDSKPTVSRPLLLEEKRASVLHVNPEQEEQGEDKEPSHKTDQRMSQIPLPCDWDFYFFER